MERKRILVVDDDEKLRESIKMIFDKDYEVMFAENGNMVVEFFETPNNISLLILDIKLPDIDGVEVLKKIREKQVEIPVVIITRYSKRGLYRAEVF